ncbi:hypothetical protein FACS1894111_01840 [Clostridia bacterium]|nr:hypothetical protein FACS1894111_01840 [Clostridia bacterium]
MLGYEHRMDSVLANAVCVPLHPERSYVLMSDCHRGDGNWHDNFAGNKTVYLAALREYYERGYSYFELGDGDELWENKRMEEIMEKHGEVFALLKKFHAKGRLFMLYGNHDMVKKNEQTMGERLMGLMALEMRKPDTAKKKEHMFCGCCPGLVAHESIFLKNCCNGKGLLLIHGHQGDFMNDTLWKLSRFLVRYLWRPLEQLGVKDPTSAAKNYKKKDFVEKRMATWAKKRQQVLVAGHTHRPYFTEDPHNAWYYNTGSGVHPYSITAIEINQGEMSLVKWQQLPGKDNYVKVEKELLGGPLPLEEILWKNG